MTQIAVACRSIAGVTGTTTGILEQTRRLAEAGWDVHLYAESIDAERARAAGGVPHRIRPIPLAGRFKRPLFAWRAGRALRRGGYDLVCGHGDTLEQDILALHNCVHLAHEWIHGAPLPASSRVGALHARILTEKRFRLLIANSQLMADEVERRFGVPAERVRVVHPGYDPKRFRPEDREALGSEIRERLGAGNETILVGLITSGDFKKRGVGTFIRALARLSPESKRVLRAVVIGQETRLGAYRQAALEAGLGERLSFLPPDADVARYYHALDIYAFPALIEEFGQSVQEAMACGVPVLTSKRVGATELLSKEARAMLLDRAEEAAFAAKLDELIRDAALRRRWSEEGLRAVGRNTWDDNFRRTLDCYNSLIK